MGKFFGNVGTGLMDFGKSVFSGIGGSFFPPNPDDFRDENGLFQENLFNTANKKYKVKKAKMDMAGDMFQKFQPKDNYIPGVKKGGGNKMGQFSLVNPTAQWTGEEIPPYSLLGIRRKERR
jgi:hypothetical protein